jgi:hypothetical protein
MADNPPVFGLVQSARMTPDANDLYDVFWGTA